MTQKQYMMPSVKVVELQQKFQILAGSNHGLNDELQVDEVDEGW